MCGFKVWFVNFFKSISSAEDAVWAPWSYNSGQVQSSPYKYSLSTYSRSAVSWPYSDICEGRAHRCITIIRSCLRGVQIQPMLCQSGNYELWYCVTICSGSDVLKYLWESLTFRNLWKNPWWHQRREKKSLAHWHTIWHTGIILGPDSLLTPDPEGLRWISSRELARE